MRLLVAALVLLTSFACSRAESKVSSQVASATVGYFSAEQLYTAIMTPLSQLSQTDKETVLSQTSAEALGEAYVDKLLSSASNTPVTIDGLDFSGGRDLLLANKPGLLAFSARYPTLGSYWSAHGIEPQALTLAQFTAGLTTAYDVTTGSSESLGLVDDPFINSVIHNVYAVKTVVDICGSINAALAVKERVEGYLANKPDDLAELRAEVAELRARLEVCEEKQSQGGSASDSANSAANESESDATQ